MKLTTKNVMFHCPNCHWEGRFQSIQDQDVKVFCPSCRQDHIMHKGLQCQCLLSICNK